LRLAVRIAKWVGGGLVLLLLLAGAVALIADTSFGHRLIADRIAALTPSSGLRIKVGRIEGSIYGTAQLHDVRLSDPNGLFFESGDITLDWTPWAWFSNRVDITSITSPAATLHRLPKFVSSEKAGPILPSFDIHIGKLAIDRVILDSGVAGPTPQHGTLLAQADIHAGRARVMLDARATGGDRLDARLDAQPDADRFELTAALDAPANGLFAQVIGTNRAAVLRIAGKGGWQDWRGTLLADTAGSRVATLALSARNGLYGVDGTLFLAGLTTGRVAALIGPVLGVKGNARLDARRVAMDLALASPALTTTVKGNVDLGTSSFAGLRIDTLIRRPAALIATMAATDLKLAVQLDGPFKTAAFDYLLTANTVAFDKTGFDGVRAQGAGRLSAAPVTLPIMVTAQRVTGVGDVAGGILAQLNVTGALKITPQQITSDALTVRSDKLNAQATLLVDLGNGRYDVGLNGQLNSFLVPGLGVVDLNSGLHAVPGANGQGARVIGRAQAKLRRLDNGFFTSLTGGLPVIDTAIERSTDGIVRFTGLTLTSPNLRVSGDGYRRTDGTIHFEGRGTQRRYGPVVIIIDGLIDRPTVKLLLARPADDAGLSNVEARLTPTAQGFAWVATGGSRLGPFSGNGTIVLPKGGSATIAIATLSASGLTARGDLRAVPGGLSGQLVMSGSGITGTLALAPVRGVQQVDTHLVARDAKLDGPPLIAARRATFDAVVRLDPAGLGIDATFVGEGLRYGSLTLARLAAHAGLSAAFAGSRGRNFDFQTVAQVAPDRVSIVGQGAIDERPLTIEGPAVATYDRYGWTLQPVSVRFADGTARVSGRYGDAGLAVDADVARLPLTVLDILSPDLGLGGIASGKLSFAQVAGNGVPSGAIDMRVRGLARSGLVLSSKPIDIGVVGKLDTQGVAVRAIAASEGATVGQAQAQIRVPPGGGDYFDKLTSAPLFAQVRYNGPADTLWRLTGVETFDLSGPVAVAADLGGTASDPQIKGSFRTDALRLESPLSGTVLTGVKAEGSFAGSELTIPSFAATAGRGTISGRVTIDLAAANGIGIDVQATADNADLIRRDDVSATVTGPLAIISDGATGTISGNVALNRSAFRLGQAKATAALPQLNVREINRPLEALEDISTPMVWNLRVTAKAEDRLAVTGLGLDSEWRADLDLGGTLDMPTILGRADVLRGGYEFAGKRFELSRGIIRFQGETPIDPIIDIEATSANQALSATVRVTGTGQRPDIAFSSVPALPQEELLSRLLFGTSITSLSAPEALQLAAAVASLQGGGGGLNPINALRQAIGLDRLRILPADATTGAKTAVAAGKYITRRTYIELVSDGQGYSASRIEFQITRFLSVLSTISTIGRTSAAVRISKDY
jgi:translocation and assembly module TamB